MAVYVDACKDYAAYKMDAETRRHGVLWCHMWCDPGDEDTLHAIAQQIGLKHEWCHGSRAHYNMIPRKRQMAINAGAIEMEYSTWLRRQRG